MINTNFIDKIALITKEKSFTYQELFQKIDYYSEKYFSNNSYSKVAIHAENSADWIFAFYAAWKNNCTVIPVDFLASANDVTYILNDCKPDLLFVSNHTVSKLDTINKELENPPKIENLDGQKSEVAIQQNQKVIWDAPNDIEKTAVIIYTSGTTGNPKGVMLSYKNLLSNIEGVSKKVKIYTQDRQVLMLLPLHHIFPLTGSMIAPLNVGGTSVMSPSMQSSDILETLKNNKVNIMIGVPRLYDLLYKSLKTKVFASFIGRSFYSIIKTLRSKKLAKIIFKKVHTGFGGYLKYLVSGGAALDKEIGTFFQTLGFDVLEGYGMTEAAPMITFTRPGKEIIGSPGQALPGLKMEIRDGEIVAKGDNIMKGYYNKPEETQDVLKDGWLYTGDLGRIDKNGYLFITGRKKEIIVLQNGKNINPVELETKLERYECITEAAVFQKNDKLHALIVPDYEQLTKLKVSDPEKYFKKELIPDINQQLTSYKRIMKFLLINEELPRTRLGKIQRFKLEDIFEKPKAKEKVAHTKEEPVSEEYKVIKTYIESQVDMTISPEDHLEFDIAMDSLGKITLIDFIERTFGVKIEEDKLIKFPSISNMVDYVKENKLFQNFELPNWSEILKEKIHFQLPKSWPTQSFIIKSARFFFKLYFKFNTKGLENIPEGAAILTPNHQSFFDGLFVTACLKRKTIKDTYFYAKRKHVNNRFLKFMAHRNNVIIMDMNLDIKESIQKMAAVLKENKKIIIFPEGTRTTNGEMGEFKKTFAILSKELNVPIVPVVIKGAYDVLPAGSKFPKPFREIEVEYLKPVYPKGRDFDVLTHEVKETIYELVS